MATKVLTRVRGVAVTLREDGSVSWLGELTIDADGSPRAYGPKGTAPLDYLANAGYPGNWWGIATDKKGNPIVQGPKDPCPGYYVSTTSYKVEKYKHGDPRRELDSERYRFIVIPAPVIRMVAPKVMGCRAQIHDLKTGRRLTAIVGDAGPATHLGEASIAVAKELGIPWDPKRGGCNESGRFQYTMWPGEFVALESVRSA